IPLVLATTGLSSEHRREADAAAHQTAVLQSPNFSLVVNVLFKLVREAAQALRDRDFDIEIIERHHRYKKDAPSGTALHFARIIQETLGEMPVRHGREGLVGEHAIVFSTLGETMELVHRGHTRDAYVRGALQAAKFLAGRPAGRYTMADV